MIHKSYLNSLTAEDTGLSLWLHNSEHFATKIKRSRQNHSRGSSSSHICFLDISWWRDSDQSVQQKKGHGHVSGLHDVGAHRSDPGASPGTPTQAPKPPVSMGYTSLCDSALASWKLSYSQASPTSWKQLTGSWGARSSFLHGPSAKLAWACLTHLHGECLPTKAVSSLEFLFSLEFSMMDF